MISGPVPAASETSLERLARGIRALFEGGVGGPAPAASTNNAVMRWDGTDGRTAKDSAATIDDSGNISAPGTVSATKSFAISVNRGGTNQTGIATNTFTKIQFTTEAFDVNSVFDNATNYRYQPGVAGKYFVSLNIFWVTVPVGTVVQAALSKTGSLVGTPIFVSPATGAAGSMGFGGSALVDMSTSDYLEFFCFHNAGVAADLSGLSGSTFATAIRLVA
jgi:hypothetical protein